MQMGVRLCAALLLVSGAAAEDALLANCAQHNSLAELAVHGLTATCPHVAAHAVLPQAVKDDTVFMCVSSRARCPRSLRALGARGLRRF